MVHLSFAFVASGFAVDGLAGPCKAHIDLLVKKYSSAPSNQNKAYLTYLPSQDTKNSNENNKANQTSVQQPSTQLNVFNMP
jgi:hypothetical protein